MPSLVANPNQAPLPTVHDMVGPLGNVAIIAPEGPIGKHFESHTLDGIRPDEETEQRMKLVLAAAVGHEAAQATRAELERLRDYYTLEHSERVTKLSVLIGLKLGLPHDQLVDLAVAGLTH